MASMDALMPHLSRVRVPQPHQIVYKDECVYSFDNPESETGLYVCLNTFLGYGRNYVEQYYHKTGNAVFLHIRKVKQPVAPTEEPGDGPEKKITRLAIGVEGGFDPELGRPTHTYTHHYAVVVLPSFTTFVWPDPALPPIVQRAVQGVLDAESPVKLAELAVTTGTWDGEARVVSKHAESLQQLENGVRVPPTGWVCARCDLTSNLWLNLTDGAILCGRRFFDGSGGNDHAVEHYRATGYPLAVKLGTITAEGKADVFSYPEDDMVEDPLLDQHLRHFGINIHNMHKTEKSIAELELEMNRRGGEWSAMEESGSELRALHGAQLTGLNNLGNTCYINSVMQVLFRIPDFVQRFVTRAPEIFATFPEDPVNDFEIQTAKLGVGLVSGRYSQPEEDGWQRGVSPHMFRNLLGRNHPEFSTKRQQDAHEFYMHFLNTLERHSRGVSGGSGVSGAPGEALRLCVEERVECGESGAVRYSRRPEQHLPLPVPVAAAVNTDQVREYEERKRAADLSGQKLEAGEVVRPLIPFSACLERFMKEELVEQFYSSALDKKVTAKKSTRLATFPDYLLIQLKKFTIREDWTPAKLDVAVDMPWEVDLSCLRGHGLQPHETPLPDAPDSPPPPQPDYNQQLLQQLLEMGFPEEACKRALFFTQNAGLEAASHWLMEHISDADFAEPFVPPGTRGGAGPGPGVSEEGLAAIESMGFTRAQAQRALAATGGDTERAVDWIFSRAGELDAEEEGGAGGGAPDPCAGCRDGHEKYKLIAFISHMGSSPSVGHYVCHVLHDQRWVIFNDNKVALSQQPPKDLAYLYLYQRI